MKKLATFNSFIISVLFFRVCDLFFQFLRSSSLRPINVDPANYWIYDLGEFFLAYLSDPICFVLFALLACFLLRLFSNKSQRINWTVFAVIVIVVCLPYRLERIESFVKIPPYYHNNSQTKIIRVDESWFPRGDIENKDAFISFQSIVIPLVDIKDASFSDMILWLKDEGEKHYADIQISNTLAPGISKKRFNIFGEKMTVLEVIEEMCMQMDCHWKVVKMYHIEFYSPDASPPTGDSGE